MVAHQLVQALTNYQAFLKVRIGVHRIATLCVIVFRRLPLTGQLNASGSYSRSRLTTLCRGRIRIRREDLCLNLRESFIVH